MTATVWVTVHHDEGERIPTQDKAFLLMFFTLHFPQAENAPGWFLVENELHAPGCPKSFHNDNDPFRTRYDQKAQHQGIRFGELYQLFQFYLRIIQVGQIEGTIFAAQQGNFFHRVAEAGIVGENIAECL